MGLPHSSSFAMRRSRLFISSTGGILFRDRVKKKPDSPVQVEPAAKGKGKKTKRDENQSKKRKNGNSGDILLKQRIIVVLNG